MKFGNSLKLEIIDYIIRKIIQLNVVITLKGSNEYYQKIISKSGLKMDLHPALLRSESLSENIEPFKRNKTHFYTQDQRLHIKKHLTMNNMLILNIKER